MYIFSRLVLLISGFSAVSCRLEYVMKPDTWLNASGGCISKGFQLACIPDKSLTYLRENDIPSVWIDLYTTFSSWIHFVGCTPRTDVEGHANKTFIIENGNSGSCQLACNGFDFFIIKEESCMCFSKLTGNRKDVAICGSEDEYKVFKKIAEVQRSDRSSNSGLPMDATKACEYLYCKKYIPEGGISVRDLNTNCTFSNNQIIAICEYPGAPNQCLNYTEFQKRHQTDEKDTDDIICTPFRISCRGGPNCQQIVLPLDGSYIRTVGLTSTLIHYNSSKPVVSCGHLYLSTQNTYEIGFHWNKDCKETTMPYYCESGDKDFISTCYLNYNTEMLPRPVLSSNGIIITSTVSVDKLRTSMESTSTGTIVGVIIGLCLISVLAVIAIVVITKRFRSSKNKKAQNRENNTDFNHMPSVTNRAYEYERGSMAYSSEYDYIKEPEHYKNTHKMNNGYEDPDNVVPGVGIRTVRECEYTESPDGDYDRLHGKRDRKIITTDQNNLYSHSQSSIGYDTYDTGYRNAPDIDKSTYDISASNSRADDNYSRLQIPKS